MTNLSSFEYVNTGHGYYFVVGARLSHFCHGINNSFNTFSSKIEYLQKREKVLRIRDER